MSLNRILDRMDDICFADAVHGPPGDRRFTYVPTHILRGMAYLGLEFTPVAGPQSG